VPIAGSIVALAFERGLLLNAPRLDALRFMPALNVSREEIDLMIDQLDAILTGLGAG
jgi:acetylornithine/N-succinyldiaminopimelate aminotransferase